MTSVFVVLFLFAAVCVAPRLTFTALGIFLAVEWLPVLTKPAFAPMWTVLGIIVALLFVVGLSGHVYGWLKLKASGNRRNAPPTA